MFFSTCRSLVRTMAGASLLYIWCGETCLSLQYLNPGVKEVVYNQHYYRKEFVASMHALQLDHIRPLSNTFIGHTYVRHSSKFLLYLCNLFSHLMLEIFLNIYCTLKVPLCSISQMIVGGLTNRPFTIFALLLGNMEYLILFARQF